MWPLSRHLWQVHRLNRHLTHHPCHHTTRHRQQVQHLIGPLEPLTNRAILWMCLRRPFGSRRVLALIHWQAAKLALKGAPFRSRPAPPPEDVTR